MFKTPFESNFFSEVYDVHPQAIVWLRPMWRDNVIIDFEYTYANDEGLNFMNLGRHQLDGLTINNSPTLDDTLRRRIMKELLNVYNTGNKSATIVYNPVLNKHARVLRAKLRDGVLTVISDITKEKHVIQELEEQKKQLEQQTIKLEQQSTLLNNILEKSSNGISVSKVFRDENGVVIDAITTLANDAAVRYIGFPRDIYLSKRATEIEPEVMGSPYYQMCVNTLKTGEPFVTQYYVNATKRWLELTVSKMDDDHLIHIFTDVTQIKEAQLELEESVKALQRSNTYLEDFAHVASHDMKEPLRKILTFADRLKRSLGDRIQENEKMFFDRIRNSAERMQLLVDDLLEFSHLKTQPEQLEKIDLNDKLRTVLSDLELEIEEKKAHVHVDSLPVVSGNRRQLQQLFHNLIGNALKYSKANVPPEIRISSRNVKGLDVEIEIPGDQKENEFYLVEVRDNGIGFEQEYSSKIFDIFQRLHKKTEYSGTGIGLSIARKVVENHNGYIWANGEPGKGATFLILLPAG